MKRTQPQYIQDIRPASNTYYQPSTTPPLQPQPEPEKLPAPEKPKKKKRWLKRILIFLFILFLLVAIPLSIILAMDVKNFASASEKLFGTSDIMDMFPASELDATPDGTVHMLVAGYSADDPGHGGATLTDSIMVLSINKNTGKGYMLSIPRDLYVEIPGHGSAKINEVYQDGEKDGFSEPGYPDGGMGLLTKVVEEVTGQDLHYYYLVNYAAVREIVDALGGITVDIQSPDTRGIYDPSFKPEEGGPLQLPNGPSAINGQTALNVTRARGLAAGSYGYPQADFNRTQYQQAVLSGMIDALSWRAVLDPRQNEALFNAVANNVETDLEINELIPMFRLMLNTDVASLANYTLRDLNGKNYLTNFTTASGQSALIPTAGKYDYSEIQAAIREIEAGIVI